VALQQQPLQLLEKFHLLTPAPGAGRAGASAL
jgi:hypothetical protein